MDNLPSGLSNSDLERVGVKIGDCDRRGHRWYCFQCDDEKYCASFGHVMRCEECELIEKVEEHNLCPSCGEKMQAYAYGDDGYYRCGDCNEQT